MTSYIAVLLPERVGWSVLFPDLPGCTTQGDSIQEAIRMAGDALAGCRHVADGLRLGKILVLEQVSHSRYGRSIS